MSLTMNTQTQCHNSIQDTREPEQGGMNTRSFSHRLLLMVACMASTALPLLMRGQYTGGPGRGGHMVELLTPPNDACGNAKHIPVRYLCTGTTGSNAHATPSLAPMACQGLSVVANDVWYSFTATEAAHRVKVVGNGTFAAVVDVRATCNGASLGCDNAPPGGAAQVDLSGLAAGSTYYVRVYNAPTDPGANSFTICVQLPDCEGVYDGPAILGYPCDDGNPNTVSDAYTAACQCMGQPLSNECAGAIPLAVGFTCNIINGSNVGATQSIAPITCNGNTSSVARDVWFEFTATGPSHRVFVSGNGVFDPIIDVRAGNCNGTSIGCADASVAGGSEVVSLTGLVTNAVYLVRVYCWAGCQGNFTICVQRPDCQGVYGGPARPGVACDDGNPATVNDAWNAQCQCAGTPVNDECSGAIALTTGFTCAPVTGSATNATQSLPPITCNTTTSTAANDVWYKFTATSSQHRVRVVGNGAFDPIVDVRASCTSGTLACADATFTGGVETVDLTDLLPGQDCYVRVYCWGGCNGTFSICVETPDCAGVYGGTIVPFTPCDDGNALTMYDEWNEQCQCTGTPAEISVAPKVFLEGAYDPATGLMNDALRTQGLLPLVQPYSELGYSLPSFSALANPTVFATTGPNAIVDWVIVELRKPASGFLMSQAALLQRDGDVVSTDGVSPIKFQWLQPDFYHVAVRHRNHLGVMTAAPVSLGILAATVDFRVAGTATWGTNARKSVSGTFPAQVLWAGDVTFNGQIKYTGSGNDRDQILQAVGGTVPTNTVSGQYRQEDVDMNGTVKYTGAGNDRDIILQGVGGTVPTAVRNEQLP